MIIAGILATILPYGPALSEHCVLGAGLEPGRNPAQQQVSPEELERLIEAVRGWEAWLDRLKDTPPKGYISYKAGGETLFCSCMPNRQVYAHTAPRLHGVLAWWCSILAVLLYVVSC